MGGYSRATVNLEGQVGREVKAMTRREVITKAIDGQLSWGAAADILAITPRQMRRIPRAIERGGMSAGRDQCGRGPPGEPGSAATIPKQARLNRAGGPDLSARRL